MCSVVVFFKFYLYVFASSNNCKYTVLLKVKVATCVAFKPFNMKLWILYVFYLSNMSLSSRWLLVNSGGRGDGGFILITVFLDC